jgi:hypothetical protein
MQADGHAEKKDARRSASRTGCTGMKGVDDDG